MPIPAAIAIAGALIVGIGTAIVHISEGGDLRSPKFWCAVVWAATLVGFFIYGLLMGYDLG